MTNTQQLLWQRIQEFQLDDPEANFTFSARLARENGWSKSFTMAAIQEYKKFMYLCCVADQPITPSDAVDQVWHLHLTYTKNYWQHWCQDTLGQQIHHNPTKGGKQEAQKFDHCYSHLQTVYQAHFNRLPPIQIWPGNQQRFSDINFKRVNLARNWVIAKPSLLQQKRAAVVVMGLVGMASIYAVEDKIILAVLGGLIGILILTLILFPGKITRPFSRRSDGDGGGGCTACGSDGHSGHSGCSGCSGDGCSGCSGCGGGD